MNVISTTSLIILEMCPGSLIRVKGEIVIQLMRIAILSAKLNDSSPGPFTNHQLLIEAYPESDRKKTNNTARPTRCLPYNLGIKRRPLINFNRSSSSQDWIKNIDSPINDSDPILQIMFSGRHISVNWTIMGRSSLCYLKNGFNLMKGRRLEP